MRPASLGQGPRRSLLGLPGILVSLSLSAFGARSWAAGLEDSPGERPQLAYAPERPRPGDLLRLRVTASSATVAEARLLEHRFVLVRGAAGRLEGFLALPIEAEPGHASIVVTVPGHPPVKGTVDIAARTFRSSALRVNRRYTEETRPPELEARLRQERAAMAAVWARHPGPFSSGGRPRPPAPPVVKPRVTAVFGTERVFNGAVQSRHYGLDLRGRVGDPVFACLPGRVVLSGMRYFSGGTLVLDHGGGLHTLYFHLSARDVRVGDRVEAGQRLGAVGRSGRVTGPHLHLSVAVREASEGPPRGLYVDPEPFLEGAFLFDDERPEKKD